MDHTALLLFDPIGFLAEHDRAFRGVLALPDGLPDLLRISYIASLETEEGRPVRFSAHLVEPTADLYGMLKYAAPEPLTLEGLRRLAPAVDRTRTCIVVSKDEKGLHIRGLEPLGPFDSVSEESRGSARPIVSVRGPGRIDLDISNGVLRYESGGFKALTSVYDIATVVPRDIYHWHFDYVTVPVDGMLGKSMHFTHVEKPVNPERFAEHHAEFVMHAESDVPQALAAWIIEVVIAVQRLEHGGSCLVLPVGHPPFEKFASRGIALVNSSSRYAGRWNRGLLNYSCLLPHYWFGKNGKTLLDDRLSSASFSTAQEIAQWANGEVHEELGHAQRQMRSDAARLARLMQIDGALVVDQSFQPLWLGTTLRLPDPEKPGHRRASLLAAVTEVPGSMGLLVSQDGTATMISRQSGKVGMLPLAM